MEEFESIRNDALITAYEAMYKDNTKESQNAVTEQMIRTTFLLPVLPVEGKDPEDFPAKLLRNEKGELFLPLLTDLEHATPNMPAPEDTLIAVDISDVYSYLVENEKLQGIIVNPFAKPNLVCVRATVEVLAKLWSRIKTAELNGEDPKNVLHPPKRNLQLMIPKEFPAGAVPALNDALQNVKDVKNAWMCLVQRTPDQRPEERDWMVILDTELTLKGREEDFRLIGRALTQYLGKNRTVIFAELTENLKTLTSQAAPLYRRSEETV